MQNQTNNSWDSNIVKAVHTMRDLSKLIPKQPEVQTQEVQPVQTQTVTQKQSSQLRTPEWHAKHERLQEAMRYTKNNPTAVIAETARKFGINGNSLYSAIHAAKVRAKKKMAKARAAKAAKVTTVTEKADKKFVMAGVFTSPKPIADMVNHPAHYKVGGIETIDFIEAKGLNYNLGNVVKYITRSDHKGSTLEDLQKAAWYLAREIQNLKK